MYTIHTFSAIKVLTLGDVKFYEWTAGCNCGNQYNPYNSWQQSIPQITIGFGGGPVGGGCMFPATWPCFQRFPVCFYSIELLFRLLLLPLLNFKHVPDCPGRLFDVQQSLLTIPMRSGMLPGNSTQWYH